MNDDMEDEFSLSRHLKQLNAEMSKACAKSIGGYNSRHSAENYFIADKRRMRILNASVLNMR